MTKKAVCVFDENAERRLAMASCLPGEHTSHRATDCFDTLASWLDDSDLILVHDSNTKIRDVFDLMDASGVHIPVCGYSRYPKIERLVSQIKIGAIDYFLLPVEENFVERLLMACGEGRHVSRDRHTIVPSEIRSLLPIEKLSARELATAQKLAQGLRSLQIAQELDIPAATIDTHARRIYRKLGVSGRVELIKKKHIIAMILKEIAKDNSRDQYP